MKNMNFIEDLMYIGPDSLTRLTSNITLPPSTMFKSVNGASKLNTLLRDSKLSQLQMSIGDHVLESNKFPTHQIIEAPTSSFSRRDFGLKMRIPKKIKSRRIIINDLDNKYGLPNFEKYNGDMFKKQRFQELGIPVTVSQSKHMSSTKKNDYSNPLFPSSKSATNKSVAELLHIKNQPLNSVDFSKNIKPELKKLRKPFYLWLAKNYPSAIKQNIPIELFDEFIRTENPMNLNKNKNFIPSTYYETLSGTAGLSYNLQGRLFQTPYGPQTTRIVPSRLVQRYGNVAQCAVGGFVARVQNANATYIDNLANQNRPVENGKFAREYKIPTAVKSAVLHLDNKNLELNVEPVKHKIQTQTQTLGKSRKQFTNQASLIESILGTLKK